MASGRNHRILITGAGGFVGTHLRAELAGGGNAQDCTVIAPGVGGRASVDILDRDAVEAMIRESRPTAVVHLAAIAAPADARRSPRRAWDVNLTGTLNLAEAIKRHVPDARFVYVGSSEAYGASFVEADVPVVEDTVLKPATVYAATKAAADVMIGQMAHDGLDVVRFRPFNHTGPGQTTAYVVPAFASQIASIMAERSEPVIRVGNLEAERDFLDVRDIVRAYAMAATSGPANAGSKSGDEAVYNLSSGRAWRIGAILEKLIAASNMSISVTVDPEKLRPNDVPRAVGDPSRAERVFGWRATIALEETLEAVLAEHVAASSRRRTVAP